MVSMSSCWILHCEFFLFLQLSTLLLLFCDIASLPIHVFQNYYNLYHVYVYLSSVLSIMMPQILFHDPMPLT